MKRAFTLFELVMTLLVIALLVSASLKFSSASRESAYDAQCKSNLRELARSCTRYAMEKGEFPWGLKTVSGYSSYCWDFVKREDSSVWEPGEMWQGYKASSVVCCPKCRAENDNWDGCGLTGYNYNCAYVGKVEGDSGVRTKPLKWSRVECAERLVLFGDAGYAGGMNKFMRAPMSDALNDASAIGLRESGNQAFRHGKGKARHCNMAFADGHVEEFHQPYLADGKEGWVDESTHTAFIAPDNVIYGGAEE